MSSEFLGDAVTGDEAKLRNAVARYWTNRPPCRRSLIFVQTIDPKKWKQNNAHAVTSRGVRT